MKKYQVIFKFRSGDVLELFTKLATIYKGESSPDNLLYFDKLAVANVGRGSPNYINNDRFTLYGCAPLPSLYDLMPSDWDKTKPSLRLIDEVIVYTITQERPDD